MRDVQTISILYLQLFYKSKTIFKLKVYSYIYILFLIGGQLLYNIGFVSAIYQHETAIGTHVPSLLNSPPTTHPSKSKLSWSLSSRADHLNTLD